MHTLFLWHYLRLVLSGVQGAAGLLQSDPHALSHTWIWEGPGKQPAIISPPLHAHGEAQGQGQEGVQGQGQEEVQGQGQEKVQGGLKARLLALWGAASRKEVCALFVNMDCVCEFSEQFLNIN